MNTNRWLLGISSAYVLFLFSFQATSQSSIRAQVVDSITTPLSDVVVNVLSANDSSFLASALSDEEGWFVFAKPNVDSVIFFMQKELYQATWSTVYRLDLAKDRNLGQVKYARLMEHGLKEISVVARVPYITRKAGCIVVKPGALPSNAGLTLIELLQKSPGVLVDQQGNISLNGKPGVTVLIDNKPTYLAGDQLSAYLRSIPSDLVAEINIMSTPPAQYDAEGSAGIINVMLKRSRDMGWSGGFSTSYGQGFYLRTNNSANLTYRLGKFNFYSSGSLGQNNSYQDLILRRKYYADGGALNSSFEQHTFIKTLMGSQALRGGVDWYVSSKVTAGITASTVQSLHKSYTSNMATVANSSGVLNAAVTAFAPLNRKLTNQSFGAYADVKLDSLGSKLSINADYLGYTAHSTQGLSNKVFNEVGALQSTSAISGKLPSQIDIYTAKVDWVKPTMRGVQFSAGAKTSAVNTTNVASFVNDDGSVNLDFSNDFSYKERVQACYSNVEMARGKWSLQSGMRMEYTFIQGNQQGNEVQRDSSFTRAYASLFPTFFVSYTSDSLGNHQWSASYGRRIQRPNYEDMNPFTYPMDKFTLYSGNPFLNPAFSNAIDFTYTYKNSTSITVSFSRSHDVISETIEQNEGIFYSRPGNIGEQWGSGVSFYTSQMLKKWFGLQVYTEWMFNEYSARLYGGKLLNRAAYAYVEPTLQFFLGEKLSLETACTYQSAMPYAQFRLIPVWSARFGLACKVMKQRGSLKLNVSDIFHTNRPGGAIQGLVLSDASWKSILDTRVVTVSFSLQLSKGKALKAHSGTSADTEKSRVK